ncbi:hypothetical protein QBC40DRAFT_178657 [Triangularia verruculosa]|uniref:Uncharacterized protein n=1 Tax=Triangularia verruculosa TaxID=2587418 RepID=A0AAN6XDA1_9PEZI|nr:hypothetical protein QBC40DRAFT_178657 [Triangularia verruculosa]
MERAVCRATSTYTALIPPLLSQAYSTRPLVKQWTPPGVKQWALPSSVIWETNQAVKDFAALHRITNIDALKTIPKQTKLKVLRVYASRTHAFDPQHEQYLQYQEHSMTRKILWRCYEWKVKRPLWFYSTAVAADGCTAVMRRQSEGKAMAAIKAAVKANGFGIDGIELDGRGRVIYGTIRLVISSPRSLLDLEWSELVDYLASLVRYQILPTYAQLPGYPRRSSSASKLAPKSAPKQATRSSPRPIPKPKGKPESFTII